MEQEELDTINLENDEIDNWELYSVGTNTLEDVHLNYGR